jgi:hypothetical protein
MAGDVLKAGGPGPEQIKVGMPVVGVDGKPVGKVKEVRQTDFLVDRPLAHDVFVPFSFVLATESESERIRGGPRREPEEVVLTIGAAHVDTQDWPHA